MTIEVDAASLYTCSGAMRVLGADVTFARSYLARHVEVFDASRDGGLLMGMILSAHNDYSADTRTALDATDALLYGTGDALHTAGRLYEQAENDALVKLGDLFRDLDPSTWIRPITSTTDVRALQEAFPSDCLVPPISVLADPAFQAVWNILSWPDYLSIAWWVRQAISAAVNFVSPGFTGGEDVFEYLAQQLSGDWDTIALAGDAFGNIGKYYGQLADAVESHAVKMFEGWTEGDGARSAGEYLAELVGALGAQCEVYDLLDEKYREAAWGAFGACQTLLSALDALVDLVIAETLGVGSVFSAGASIVTGGGTAPAAVVTSVIALVEAFSAAWGVAMAAVSAMIAIGGTLGAATLEITRIPLPEG